MCQPKALDSEETA
jgi:hypothetical protein